MLLAFGSGAGGAHGEAIFFFFCFSMLGLFFCLRGRERRPWSVFCSPGGLGLCLTLPHGRKWTDGQNGNGWTHGRLRGHTSLPHFFSSPFRQLFFFGKDAVAVEGMKGHRYFPHYHGWRKCSGSDSDLQGSRQRWDRGSFDIWRGTLSPILRLGGGQGHITAEYRPNDEECERDDICTTNHV